MVVNPVKNIEFFLKKSVICLTKIFLLKTDLGGLGFSCNVTFFYSKNVFIKIYIKKKWSYSISFDITVTF